MTDKFAGKWVAKNAPQQAYDPTLGPTIAELRAENGRLRAALQEIMVMSEPGGYGEKSKAQVRDVARRALGRD